MNPASIVVTGATGFLGGAVWRSLQASGTPALGLDIVPGEGVGVCDLADRGALAATLGDTPIAAIVHCGAVSGPMLHRENPYGVASTNIMGTLNLLELARLRQVPRFVFCSTASVYGPQPVDRPVGEDAPLHPSSAYAASKVAGEALVQAYRAHGIHGTSLRIAAIYGPGRRTPCHIRDMLLALQHGRNLRIPHGAAQRFHYVHIDDAVASIRSALDGPAVAGDAYTIAGDSGILLRDLAGLVERLLGRGGLTVGAKRDPDLDDQGPFALERAARELGWRPKISLEEGIASYADALAEDLQVS